ncbi:hypothetical protein [Pseudomonas sputi]|uniref:hypothetical protein n=1 Tax=Pseudomonas sputi TaxID=2892325 RepID=UPI001F2007C7|nr:hypothetical protein [Pseudomonas sputi]
MTAEFGRSFPCNIFIYQDFSDNSPITLYEKSPCGAYKINLNVTDRYWCKYIYQFSHEYCHIRTNYSLSRYDQRIKWFEETICELASIFTLKKMSISWKTNPPLPSLKSFSDSIAEYVKSIITDPSHQLPKGSNFPTWFKDNLPLLERNQYIRDSNSLIAITLLPLFEKHPSLWNSMTYWNSWKPNQGNDIHSCLQLWLKSLPEKNKEGATSLADIFNI